MKENRRMWTCNRLDLQILGCQPVMPKNLPGRWAGTFDNSMMHASRPPALFFSRLICYQPTNINGIWLCWIYRLWSRCNPLLNFFITAHSCHLIWLSSSVFGPLTLEDLFHYIYSLIWNFLLSQINVWTTTTWSNVWVVLPNPSWYEFIIGFLIWTPASKYLQLTTFSNIVCDFMHVLIFVVVSKCRKNPKLTNIVISHFPMPGGGWKINLVSGHVRATGRSIKARENSCMRVQWMGRTGSWLQMNRLSLRNNRVKVIKTAGKLPSLLEDIYRICPNLIKENWRISTCNRLDLQTLARISTGCGAQKSPRSLCECIYWTSFIRHIIKLLFSKIWIELDIMIDFKDLQIDF